MHTLDNLACTTLRSSKNTNRPAEITGFVLFPCPRPPFSPIGEYHAVLNNMITGLTLVKVKRKIPEMSPKIKQKLQKK